jgi:phosphate-selective porin OprO/OprP
VGSTDIVDTAWVNYGFTPALQLRVGKFKQQFNLEELTSSNNIDFVERSYINQFAPAKKIGAMIHGVPMEGTTYGVSLFQEGSANVAATGNLQTSARLTANIAKLADIKDSVIHLGLAGTSGKYDSSAASVTDISIRNEQRGADSIYKLTHTGSTSVASIIDKSLLGAEAVYAYGPFKMQSEYAVLKIKADHVGVLAADADAKLWYVSALYNITGEKWSDAYKDGAFGSIKPLVNFDTKNGGTGALQIGARYSQYDVTKTTGTASTTATSPKGTTATLGLTWFVNSNMRVMLDHSMTKLDNNITLVTGATGNKESVTTIRTQYNF